MFTVLSSFADEAAARRGVDALAREGFAPDTVRVHSQPAPENAASVKVDEIATGGFVHNAFNLLDSLFNTDTYRDEAANYADLVRQGGILVSVEVADAERARQAQEALERLGGARSTSIEATDRPG
jgi:hypothetical protein